METHLSIRQKQSRDRKGADRTLPVIVRQRTCTIALLSIVTFLDGCQAAAFMAGSRGEKVKAQFKLSEGPILVFIDDKNERVDWPAARRFLWDDLSQELIRTKTATKIIPIGTEDAIRQTTADFGKLSCRELGELAGADQVLWIEVQDFLVNEQITEATNAAYFTVTVKVINPKEKESRSKVRLWPTTPEGQRVTAGMTGGAVIEQKNKDAISRILTARLAVDIARLFHDHKKEF